jgi:hypothetical protein
LGLDNVKLANQRMHAVEQIVGPERRLRVLHHHWSGALV